MGCGPSRCCSLVCLLFSHFFPRIQKNHRQQVIITANSPAITPAAVPTSTSELREGSTFLVIGTEGVEDIVGESGGSLDDAAL